MPETARRRNRGGRSFRVPDARRATREGC
jgi:hypothetical protein